MKKYWWVFIIVLVLLILPFALYLIIKLPLGFNAIGGEDAPRVWLSFWGSYLAALISSITAFIILWITYNQNREEHKANRDLQIQAILQQQEKDRMFQLRKACTIYSNVFDINEFIAIVEDMKYDGNLVALKVKKSLTDLGVMYSDLIMYLPISDVRPQEELLFIDSINDFNEQVTRLVLDIQEINRYVDRKRHDEEQRSFIEYILLGESKISTTFKQWLDEKTVDDSDLPDVIISYIFTYINTTKVLQTAMQVYFKFKNSRINNILNLKGK